MMIIVGSEPKIMQGPRRTGSHANVEEGARNEAWRPEGNNKQKSNGDPTVIGHAARRDVPWIGLE